MPTTCPQGAGRVPAGSKARGGLGGAGGSSVDTAHHTEEQKSTQSGPMSELFKGQRRKHGGSQGHRVTQALLPLGWGP